MVCFSFGGCLYLGVTQLILAVVVNSTFFWYFFCIFFISIFCVFFLLLFSWPSSSTEHQFFEQNLFYGLLVVSCLECNYIKLKYILFSTLLSCLISSKYRNREMLLTMQCTLVYVYANNTIGKSWYMKPRNLDKT